ncbi:RNA polymerase sigma 32 subunit [Sphingopyxis sp. 113P3]|nr:RNA polymerase sigma 32 subunit [Sphingopyxis sp. 113P3]
MSHVCDVSRKPARQIEVHAFEKLQKAMLKLASEPRLVGA